MGEEKLLKDESELKNKPPITTEKTEEITYVKDLLLRNENELYRLISESTYKAEPKIRSEKGLSDDGMYLMLKKKTDNPFTNEYVYYKKVSEENINIQLMYSLYSKSEAENIRLKLANEQLNEIFKIQRFFYILTILSLIGGAVALLIMLFGH